MRDKELYLRKIIDIPVKFVPILKEIAKLEGYATIKKLIEAQIIDLILEYKEIEEKAKKLEQLRSSEHKDVNMAE